MPRPGETDRWPPKTNELPDLSHLESVSLNLLLNAYFGGAGPVDRNAKALWINFTRLVDQMLWEYNSARNSLQRFVDTPNSTISPLLRAIAHMESFVNAMRRAILFARRMRKHLGSPFIEKLAVLSESTGRQLLDVRNAIEHLESSILKNEIPEDGPITLIVQSDRIELLGIEILYKDLSEWAIQLHELASQLSDYRDPARQ